MLLVTVLMVHRSLTITNDNCYQFSSNIVFSMHRTVVVVIMCCCFLLPSPSVGEFPSLPHGVVCDCFVPRILSVSASVCALSMAGLQLFMSHITCVQTTAQCCSVGSWSGLLDHLYMAATSALTCVLHEWWFCTVMQEERHQEPAEGSRKVPGAGEEPEDTEDWSTSHSGTMKSV